MTDRKDYTATLETTWYVERPEDAVAAMLRRVRQPDSTKPKLVFKVRGPNSRKVIATIEVNE